MQANAIDQDIRGKLICPCQALLTTFGLNFNGHILAEQVRLGGKILTSFKRVALDKENEMVFNIPVETQERKAIEEKVVKVAIMLCYGDENLAITSSFLFHSFPQRSLNHSSYGNLIIKRR